MSVVWLNGALVEESAAALSVRDRGFTLGDGLFETMRAYGAHVVGLDAHLERLRRSAARIGLPLPAGLEDAVRAAVEANGLESAAVRLTVSRGVGDGLAPPASPEPTVVVAVRPYLPPEAWYARGVRAVLASGRLNEHAATAGLKRIGCLDQVVAQQAARAAGADEALFLDTAGHLAEGAASNLFVVVGGELRTPPAGCGVLPGITRAAVLALAAGAGIPAREEPLEPGVLAEASEAFLTSSLREVVPLVAVEGRPVGDGRPGPLARRLLALYRARVRAELEGAERR